MKKKYIIWGFVALVFLALGVYFYTVVKRRKEVSIIV